MLMQKKTSLKAYAGVGARKTPPEILQSMCEIAEHLAQCGYQLRSGAADGADSAFERGCDRAGGSKQIYLPWKGFNNHTSRLYPPTAEALQIAQRYHQAWHGLRSSVKKLMARNSYQVLGHDLTTPVQFVLCWTPDGATTKTSRQTGGTGQAIRIAAAHDIPVFNLYLEDHHQRLQRFVAGGAT